MRQAAEPEGVSSTAPRVSVVVAMARHRVIGYQNRLPWRLPADLAHFRRLTLDKTILMGRRTWESLPRLLDRRRHIVVSRDPDYRAPGCILVASPQAALALASANELMVIGGATLYGSMLPFAQRIYLTEVAAEVPGDAFFPAWDRACWREASRSARPRDARNPYDLAFVTLERVHPDTARP